MEFEHLNIGVMHSSAELHDQANHTRDSEALGLLEVLKVSGDNSMDGFDVESASFITEDEINNFKPDPDNFLKTLKYDMIFVFVVGRTTDEKLNYIKGVQGFGIPVIAITQDPNWDVETRFMPDYLITAYRRKNSRKLDIDYLKKDKNGKKLVSLLDKSRVHNGFNFGAITDLLNFNYEKPDNAKLTKLLNQYGIPLSKAKNAVVYFGSLKQDRAGFFRSINDNITDDTYLFGHFTKSDYEHMIGETARYNVFFPGRTATPFEVIDLYQAFKTALLMPDQKMITNKVEYARMHELNTANVDVLLLTSTRIGGGYSIDSKAVDLVKRDLVYDKQLPLTNQGILFTKANLDEQQQFERKLVNTETLRSKFSDFIDFVRKNEDELSKHYLANQIKSAKSSD